MAPWKQCLADTAGQKPMRPHRHHGSMHMKFMPHEVPALREASGQGVQHLTKTLFATDTCWQRKKNEFSPVECHCVFQPYSGAIILLRLFPLILREEGRERGRKGKEEREGKRE